MALGTQILACSPLNLTYKLLKKGTGTILHILHFVISPWVPLTTYCLWAAIKFTFTFTFTFLRRSTVSLLQIKTINFEKKISRDLKNNCGDVWNNFEELCMTISIKSARETCKIKNHIRYHLKQSLIFAMETIKNPRNLFFFSNILF